MFICGIALELGRALGRLRGGAMSESKRMSKLEERAVQRLLSAAIGDPSPSRANRALDVLIRRLLLLQHSVKAEGRKTRPR